MTTKGIYAAYIRRVRANLRFTVDIGHKKINELLFLEIIVLSYVFDVTKK